MVAYVAAPGPLAANILASITDEARKRGIVAEDALTIFPPTRTYNGAEVRQGLAAQGVDGVLVINVGDTGVMKEYAGTVFYGQYSGSSVATGNATSFGNMTSASISGTSRGTMTASAAPTYRYSRQTNFNARLLEPATGRNLWVGSGQVECRRPPVRWKQYERGKFRHSHFRWLAKEGDHRRWCIVKRVGSRSSATATSTMVRNAGRMIWTGGAFWSVWAGHSGVASVRSYTLHRVIPAESGEIAENGHEVGPGTMKRPTPSSARKGLKEEVEEKLVVGDRVMIRYIDDERSRPESYILSDKTNDPKNGILLLSSPLGKALSEAAPGDEFTVRDGDRERTVLFVAIERESAQAAWVVAVVAPVWVAGNSVTFTLNVDEAYFQKSAQWDLRFCVGNVIGCVPSQNLLNGAPN
jgi:hypothetical protein